MCHRLCLRKSIVQVMVIVVVLGVTGPVSAIDHWWHGGISNNVNDPANWTDRDTSTEPTTPTGNPRDIVRIGGSWDSEDLNGNGILDPGEDLNGNGVIDDPNPGFGVGYGGYYGSGGGIELAVNPVLNSAYVSRTGTAEGGWWFVLNAPNILTLQDGAFLIMDEENCNLRNGGRLEVQGRSDTGGPSLITARRFRIAENGSIPEAAQETSQLRINGTGWVQMDPTLDGNGEAFMIGTSSPPSETPRGEIIIEEQGRLELLLADPAPYLVFGNRDPQVNQIILRDDGELWLPGNPETMGRVGPDDAVTSLEDMIAMGLITSDQGVLAVIGSNPTIVKVAEQGISNPSPADGQSNVAQQVVLGWDPGTRAEQFDVYFGIAAADVNDADRNNPLDVLKSQGQAQTLYPLADALSLEFGQTYYWRIDEVNTFSDPPISKGELWSFTVEPFAFSISAEDIVTTASSQAAGQGPEKTIDGSGLVDGLHSTVLEDMWYSQPGETGSAWIQYEFDKIYQLHEMLVWNYNGQFLLRAAGIKDVVVEHSIDGMNWTPIDSVSEFAQATGTDDYAHNTTIAFNATPVKYVRINANSNWSNGFINEYGLSEVQFLYIPVGARMPVPDDEATDVAIDAILSWRAGREAAEHQVYIGTDSQAVADGTVPAETVLSTSVGPLSLDLGRLYYWRVDEVNNAEANAIWQGGVWSFTTQQYLVVEDFESYNDIAAGEEGSNLVYETWVDGYENPATNGSTMGYVTGKSLETLTVHGGRKSAPIMYDNSQASVSEVTVSTSALAIGSDWTVGAPETLVLWVYGDSDNPATDQMYVKVDGAKVLFNGNLALAAWQEFPVDLAALGVSLNNVRELTIGFEKTGATGGSGTVFVDDIWLFSPVVTGQ